MTNQYEAAEIVEIGTAEEVILGPKNDPFLVEPDYITPDRMLGDE